MNALQLALRFLTLLQENRMGKLDAEQLYSLCAKDMTFTTPAYNFHNAKDYIESLKLNPPSPFSFSLLHSFEATNSATLIYYFSNANTATYMSQTFEVEKEKIVSILLIYDSAVFQKK